MRLLLAVSLLLVSCSYSITNDYIDFVKANGIEYISVDYFGGGAGVGRALVDIEGKVVGIALMGGKDGRAFLGRITDRSRIDDLVRLVLSAPVDQSPPPAAASPRSPLSTPTAQIQIRNYGVFVSFELADGT